MRIWLLLIISILCMPCCIFSQELTSASVLPEKSLEIYKQELSEARKSNRHEDQARILFNIARVLKNEDAGKSLEHLKEALSIAKRIHHNQLAADISLAIVGHHKEQENYKEALFALEEHEQLLGKLLVARNKEELLRIQSDYSRKTERAVGISLLSATLLILLMVWLYQRRTSLLNKQLATSNQVKDKLFSIIGHDLRGPIGASVEMLKLLEDGEFTELQRRQFISELRKQGEASFDIASSLLRWGNTQLQRVIVNPEIFDPKNVIAGNIALLKSQALAKDIIIIDHTSAGLFINTDPDHFDFIIRNLLSNAIKFSHTSGIVEVNADSTTKNGRVVFSVKDHGVGISNEMQRKFADANIDVSFGTKGEKGTGIGLLLTKEFIRADKGELWLESTNGEGSTFYFSTTVALPGTKE